MWHFDSEKMSWCWIDFRSSWNDVEGSAEHFDRIRNSKICKGKPAPILFSDNKYFIADKIAQTLIKRTHLKFLSFCLKFGYILTIWIYLNISLFFLLIPLLSRFTILSSAWFWGKFKLYLVFNCLLKSFLFSPSPAKMRFLWERKGPLSWEKLLNMATNR